MLKQDCIIDACSYVYLKKFTFLKSGESISPFDLLNKMVNIKHHKIISDEIKRTVNKNSIQFGKDETLKISNREYSLQKFPFNHYDKVLYDYEITNSKSEKDKGEKYNLISAIDILLKKGAFPIYLTDDIKATKEKKILNDFLLQNIWTSFDAIIFIFLLSDEMKYDTAKKAITDLINFQHRLTYKNYVENRDKKISEQSSKKKEILNDYSEKIHKWNEKTQKRKLNYLNRLKQIERLKSKNKKI